MIPGRTSIRILASLSISIAIFCVSAPSAFSQDGPKSCKVLSGENGPRLATGPSDSSYFRFATQLKELNGVPLERLQVCTTQGSMENLELLSEGKVEFAVVQGDVMHEGWSKDEPPDGEVERWRRIHFENLALARRLYSEKLQIATGPHSYISSPADLRLKRVWLGPGGSGSRSTAQEVLRAAGVDVKEVSGIKNYQEANENILNGKLDAYFRVTSVPVDRDREEDQDIEMYHGSLTYLLDREPEVRLLNLDQTLIDRILQSPAYVQVPIYRDTYPNQQNGIRTIGIEAMLVTRLGNSPGDSEVIAINEALTNTSKALGKRTNIYMDLIGTRLDLKGDSEERKLAPRAHPAAKAVLLVNPNERYYVSAVVAVVAVILMFFSFRNKRALEALGGNSRYLVNGGLLASACGLFGIALWYYEGKFSFGFHNPVYAAQSLLVYFARGLKTDTLMTQQGQLIALVALAVMATLVHSINSSALDAGVDTWSKKLSRWFYKLAAGVQPDYRHYVILNWDKEASDKVAEWSNDPANKNSKITIISPEMIAISSTPQSDKIEILRGDPKSLEMLEKARVQDAKLVSIRPAWSRSDPFDRRQTMDVELADNYTIRAIHTIRAYEWRSHSKHPVPINAEIFLENNWQEAKCAGGPGTNIQSPLGGVTEFGKAPQAGKQSNPRTPPN